jgi:hypothetical protein
LETNTNLRNAYTKKILTKRNVLGVLAHSVDDVTLDSDANLENEEEGEEEKDVVVVKEEKFLY